jgi:hypothetical protein
MAGVRGIIIMTSHAGAAGIMKIAGIIIRAALAPGEDAADRHHRVQ